MEFGVGFDPGHLVARRPPRYIGAAVHLRLGVRGPAGPGTVVSSFRSRSNVPSVRVGGLAPHSGEIARLN